MDALTPEAIFTSVDIVLAGINQKPPALETSTSCSLFLWKGLLTSPPSPQWGSSGLTFTTLDTRTERGAHGKHLSFRKVQMVLMACLTCVRNSVFDRRWSSMNLSRDLARVFLSSIMSLGTGDQEYMGCLPCGFASTLTRGGCRSACWLSSSLPRHVLLWPDIIHY